VNAEAVAVAADEAVAEFDGDRAGVGGAFDEEGGFTRVDAEEGGFGAGDGDGAEGLLGVAGGDGAKVGEEVVEDCGGEGLRGEGLAAGEGEVELFEDHGVAVDEAEAADLEDEAVAVAGQERGGEVVLGDAGTEEAGAGGVSLRGEGADEAVELSEGLFDDGFGDEGADAAPPDEETTAGETGEGLVDRLPAETEAVGQGGFRRKDGARRQGAVLDRAGDGALDPLVEGSPARRNQRLGQECDEGLAGSFSRDRRLVGWSCHASSLPGSSRAVRGVTG